MKSVPKLIRRFAGILLISSGLILLLNIAALFMISSTQTASGSPYTTAAEMAGAVVKTEAGYSLPGEYLEALKNYDAWAILIEETSHQVVWHTPELPDGIPLKYSLSDISSLTLGYVKDYPTYVGKAEDGILVLGYPRTRYWKLMRPTWDYDFIANLPKTALLVLAANIALIFLIYVVVNSKLLKSVKPITSGIQALSTGNSVHVREKGLLSEVAFHINRTSEVLQSQKQQLKKKETARVNWIAGVSHDIRTPLSMVMGYADRLQNAEHLTEDERKMAAVIVKQSERIRNLINDLNLASKLEYNMQPVSVRPENAVAIVRQAAVDFINTDIDEKYPIEWLTEEALSVCLIHADRGLLKRAVSNLIQNCINHNENGCTVYVSVAAEQDGCVIRIEDNGIGASDDQIERLNTAPHYMVCDTNTTEQRHGLGLLIVKQIATAHGGTTVIEHSRFGGFAVKIRLPML